MEVDPPKSECRIYVNNEDLWVAFSSNKLKEMVMIPVPWIKNEGQSLSVLNPIIESDTVNHFFQEEIIQKHMEQNQHHQRIIENLKNMYEEKLAEKDKEIEILKS